MTDLHPSPALVEAARADRERLQGVWSGLQAQRAELLAELERIDGDIGEVVAQLRRLGELIGDQMEFPLDEDAAAQAGRASDEHVLTGAEIRRRAVGVVLGSPHAGQLLHYKDWFELVVDAGFEIKGRDPQAVFLTQISRSPLVVRGPDNGTYRLDRTAPRRLAARLEQLRAERNHIVHGNHERTTWDLDSLTAKLHTITLEASRTERQLAEATNTIRELDAEDWFTTPVDEGFQGPSVSIEAAPSDSVRASDAAEPASAA
jgi:hypothetical protein